MQLASRAEVLVAGSSMSSTTAALKSLRDVERVDLADLDAGDLDVLARDHEAGVVEDRAHVVAVLARRRRRRATHARRRRATSRSDDGGDALIMGRAAPGSGRSRRSPAVVAVRRRAVRRRLAGGARAARAACRSARPSKRCATGIGVSAPPAGLSVKLEGVEDRLDARVVAVGVVVGGALAEVAEPADEVGRVRAR